MTQLTVRTSAAASHSAPHGVSTNLKFWADAIHRRREFKRAFLPLLKERDQILSDIGYQRRDINHALALPLREDALNYVESRRLTNHDV